MTLTQIDSPVFSKKISNRAWLISSTIHIVFIAILTFTAQQSSSFSSDDRSASTQNSSVIWTDISTSKVITNTHPVVKKKQEPIVNQSIRKSNENKSHINTEKIILAPAQPTDTFVVKATEPAPFQTSTQVITTPAASHTSPPKASIEMPDTLPSTDASYLNNPKPKYPALSVRLREQGTVMLTACVNAQGWLDSVSLAKTSGYSRLDQSALDAVQYWRFIPARRSGVTIAHCYELPVNFEINSN